jgi:hypothetical protein
MKVGRQYIGKLVEIVWADPNSHRVPIVGAETGRRALATWKEYGVVHDVTDGVVLIAHSYSADSGEEKPNEMERSAVHEALIEKITIATLDAAPSQEEKPA